jgi:hypothetical protein
MTPTLGDSNLLLRGYVVHIMYIRPYIKKKLTF